MQVRVTHHEEKRQYYCAIATRERLQPEAAQEVGKWDDEAGDFVPADPKELIGGDDGPEEPMPRLTSVKLPPKRSAETILDYNKRIAAMEARGELPH